MTNWSNCSGYSLCWVLDLPCTLYSIVHRVGAFCQKIISTATKECFEFGSTTASCMHAACLTVVQIANSLVDLRTDFADFALWAVSNPMFPIFTIACPKLLPNLLPRPASDFTIILVVESWVSSSPRRTRCLGPALLCCPGPSRQLWDRPISRTPPERVPYWGLGGRFRWNCRDDCRRTRNALPPLCKLPGEWPCPWCWDRGPRTRKRQRPR